MASRKSDRQTTHEEYGAGRVEVLLVEDSSTDAELLRESLCNYPLQQFDIEHVETLDQAIQRLAQRSFDVILLDLNLPDSRGMQTGERLVRVAVQVPIIILTGTEDERLAVEAMHLGIQDYLVKEYSRGNAVGRAVRYAVERRRSQQAQEEVKEQLQAQSEELQTQTEELRVINEALEQREREYRTLAENAPEVIARFDQQLRHTYINEYGARVYGRPRQEVLGRTNAELGMPADKVAFWKERFEQVFATGRQQTIDFEFDSPTFGHQHFSSLFVPEFDAYGQAVSILAITRDVTAARRAEEQLRRRVEEVEALMKVAPVALWVANDPQCNDIIGNSAANSFYEAYEQENVSANVSAKRRFFRDGQELTPAELPMQAAAARNIDIRNTELDVLLPSGRWLNMLGSASPLRDAQGQVRGCVGAFVDITQRRQAIEGLRELNATLETRVAQRTAELRHRARQLQKLTLEMSEAEERERRRLAEILHDDLQQQLAAAKFHLGLLTIRLRGNASLQAAAAEVTGMLKDAIEKTRSLSHELSPALLYQGDFGEALEWLANWMQAKHGLVVHVETRGPAEIASDPIRAFLFRTAQEILFNIVKHARVAEAIVRLQRRRGRLWLTLSDQGRGFDPHALEQAAGFGLLSIRERVELLGGRMKIRSAPGRGSTFLIVVPDGEVGLSDAGTYPRRGAPERLRVLLADDHEVVREGLALLLNEQEDMEVVGQAANGLEAVDLAHQLQPDVVVMDVAMPLMEGDEAARQIKRDMPRTRIVGLSMFEEPDAVEKMHQAGAERYMLKTAPAEELLAAIRER